MEEESSTSVVYLAVAVKGKEFNQPIIIPWPGDLASISGISRTKIERRTRGPMSYMYLTVG